MNLGSVLHVVHGYPPEFGGGTERYVRRLAARQSGGGRPVRILAGTAAVRDRARIETRLDGDVPVHVLARGGLCGDRWDRTASPSAEGKIRALLRAVRPSVVHLHHWVRLSRAVVRLAADAGIPVVWTIHDLSATCPRFNRVLDDGRYCERPLEPDACAACAPADAWQHGEERREAVVAYRDDLRAEIQACTSFVAPSEAQRTAFCARLEVPGAEVTVLPLGVLHDLAAPRSRSVDPGGRIRVGHWGHWYRDKGVHVILDALERLSAGDRERLHVRLFGEAVSPEYGRMIERRSASLPVSLEGPFTPETLPGSELDVAVIPSLAPESHAFVLDEAFQLGLPVIASATGALAERVGAAGGLFPPGRGDALAASLRELIADPKRIERWRRAIPARLPTMKDHVLRLEDIYRAAIDAGPPQGAPPPPRRSIERRLHERVIANRETEIGVLLHRLGD